MAKRPDKNDATMDVSASQLVGNRPPVPRQPGVSNNDASMWIGNVVSTDDFAPTAVRKPSARKGRGKLIAGLLAATVVAGVGGYAAYTMASGGFSRSSPSASNAPAPAPAGKPQAAAPAAAPTDDAAVAETPAIADAGPLVVDAVSAADPVAKQTSPAKRTAIKKKVAKKKVATAKKKRRRR